MTTDERWLRIKELFGEACALPTQLREGFLEEACEGDDGLRAEVEGLLSHHTGSDLTSGPETGDGEGLHGEGTPGDGPRELAEGPGTVIDRYRLLERIGEGGMGVVWMAEQLRPIKRKVALKIIKLGMDTAEVVARFEAERQALALMDHPHIASVLDGGATESGRPFFVMELVRGVPITDWCDEAGLDTRGRLGLFRQVALAVQHAHTKGVIHRDIKPGNVLVTLHDGVPVPKVIDFGIAKAIDQELTERTCFTRYRQVIGTPECMAPEQAEMSGLDVDARADIYSLGVLLYELLTGTKPFDATTLAEAGYLEMLRTIREVEPPRPSTRVTSLGERLAAVASRRAATPAVLSRLFAGDLDWIVMKALEKDRTRRYDTAVAMADDVARHLADEPVEAGPPSALYRFRKLARRRRGAVAAAAVALVALGVGFASAALAYSRMHTQWAQSLGQREVALAQREEADRKRGEAEAEWRRSQRVNDFFSDVIGGVAPAVDRRPARTPDGLTERSRSGPGALAPAPFVPPSAPPAVPLPSDPETLALFLDHAAERIELEFADEPDTAAELRATIGRGYVTRGLWTRAGEVLPRVHAQLVAQLGADHPESLAVADEMTKVYVRLGLTDEAVDNQQQLVEILRVKRGGQAPETMAAVGSLAAVFLDAGRNEDAERVMSEVLFLAPGTEGKPSHGFRFEHSSGSPGNAERDVTVWTAGAPLPAEHLGSWSVGTVGGVPAVGAAPPTPGSLVRLEATADTRVRVLGDAPAAPPRFEGVRVVTDSGQRALVRTSADAPHDAALELELALLEERLAAAERPGALAGEKNAAAWALLTTASPELREPRESLELARAACEATQHADPVYLDTLSLALFANGLVDEALANQQRALDLVPVTATLLRADMQRRMALFRGELDEEQMLAELLAREPR